MSKDVAVLVPSRGRPGNLARLAEAVADTAPGALVIARIDDDDPHMIGYLQMAKDHRNLQTIVGARGGFVAALNEMAVLTPPDRTYLALLGDDVLPQTPGWADQMADALGPSMGVAYGDDGLRHKHEPDLPTHPMIPRAMAQILGWAALPTCQHLFPDNAWRDLGLGLGHFPFVDVNLEHLHPWAGKADRDQTYEQANDSTQRDLDRAGYEAWRWAPWGLARALEKLREYR